MDPVEPFSLRTVLVDIGRLLTFRPMSSAIARRPNDYLAVGLFFTGLAGIGRYWDNPRAHLLQNLGLGSVIYVFVLAVILWLLTLPLRPKHWSYRTVLTFVTLTSPPAILYAIPVERFLPLETAQTANAVFLGVVAAWRVALLVVFLRRVGGLSPIAITVAGFLPLTLIVVALTVLNLEHVMFYLMAGIAPEDSSPNDMAYYVVFYLAMLSAYALPVLLLAYVVLIVLAIRRSNRQPRAPDDPPSPQAAGT